MKKQIKIALVVVLFSFGSMAQEYSVDWGSLEKSTGRLINIIPRDANDFFALRQSGRGGLFSSLEVSSHKELGLVHEGKLELKAPNGSPSTYEGSTIVGDHFVVFLSDKQDGENLFFMQEYGSDLAPKSEPVELASYSIEDKKRRFQGTFSIVQSQDREHFAVMWTIPGRREEHATYGFKVFDASLEEKTSGEYEVPFQDKFSSISEFYLSDSGDLFVNITEYKESEDKKLLRSPLNYEAVHIYHINSEGQEEMVIDLDGKRVEAMSINSDNNKVFVITGIYGKRDAVGINGLFYLKADFKSQEILAEGFEEFGEDFITQDWSDRQKKKVDNKRAKGKDVQANLFNYVMREVHPLPDGSMVGSMEQYYVRVVTRTDPRTGATTTTYYYYYNDIVAYKVSADGGFEWLAKIDKYQVSTNDGGYFSSYARFVDGNKLCFFFNDNSKNYDETSDEYSITDYQPAAAKLSRKLNTVAICTVDLETGEMKRKMFFAREELGAIAVPKKFNVDYRNNELLLYAIRGSKEQFGILNFGE